MFSLAFFHLAFSFSHSLMFFFFILLSFVNLPSSFVFFSRSLLRSQVGGLFGACDVQETPSAVTYRLDAPSLTRADIKVQVIDNVLQITGERKVRQAEHQTEKKKKKKGEKGLSGEKGARRKEGRHGRWRKSELSRRRDKGGHAYKDVQCCLTYSIAHPLPISPYFRLC